VTKKGFVTPTPESRRGDVHDDGVHHREVVPEEVVLVIPL